MSENHPKTFLFPKKVTYEVPPANLKFVKNCTEKSIFPYKIIWNKFLNKKQHFSPSKQNFWNNFSKWNLVFSKSCLLKVHPENRKKLRGRRYRGPKIFKKWLWAPCIFLPLILSDFLRILLVSNFFSLTNFIYWSFVKSFVLGLKMLFFI